MPKAGIGNSAGTVRAVLDTNGWISSYISPHSPLARRLNHLLESPTITVLFSQPLREEILRVLRRPKFSKYIPAEKMAGYESEIQRFPLLPVSTVVDVCRDPKDNFLLALCHDGQADFLLTGDQDLLVLEQFGHTRIIGWAAAQTEPALQPTK